MVRSALWLVPSVVRNMLLGLRRNYGYSFKKTAANNGSFEMCVL